MSEFDVSEVRALTRAAEKAFERQRGDTFKIIAKAAQRERRTHEFQNITGLLEKNTRAQFVSFDQDPLEIALVMNRPYATHVQKRQRTDIATRRDEAAREIDYYLDSTALTLGTK